MTELENINNLLDSEAKKWDALGIHPNNLQGIFTPEKFFLVAMKMDALISYLGERDIIVDKEDFEIFHKKRMFTMLREIRHSIEKQKAAEHIAVPRPTLLGPDGNPVI